MNSSHKVYSFVINFDKFLKGNLNFSEIHELVHPAQLSRVKPNILSQCNRVYNELENHHYSYKTIAIYMTYRMLFNKKTFINHITSANIKEMKKLFDLARLRQDKRFLKDLSLKTNITNVKEYFRIEDGSSLIYDLIKNQTISPVTYMWGWNKYVVEQYPVIKESDDELKNFHKYMKVLFKIFEKGV